MIQVGGRGLPHFYTGSKFISLYENVNFDS